MGKQEWQAGRWVGLKVGGSGRVSGRVQRREGRWEGPEVGG